MDLSHLFDPRSVAIIGASGQPQKVGYALVKNIIAGAPREVYPITLNEDVILGKKAYKSIAEVPGDVDLAVIAVRADFVPKVLHECAHAGVQAAVIISAGFKETGPEGKALEAEVASIAREHGIALLGPNCLGVMHTQAGWNASFAVEAPKVGAISFISQSGAIGTALLDWASKEGVGFSKFVSLGNEAVLTELDMLEYIAEDTATSAVLMYIEQVADGPAFIERAKRVTAKKPLVVLRAGRSERGAAAVSSHTGSLAPSDAVFAAAAREAGIVLVNTLHELFAVAKLFQLGIYGVPRRLAIVTNGGGPSVNAADLISLSHSLTLTSFDDSTKDALRAVLPSMAAVGNPIDLIGDATAERYDKALAVVTELADVDAVLAIVTPQMMTDSAAIAEVLLRYRDKKPIIPALMGGRAVEAGIALLVREGRASFDQPSLAVAALEALGQGALYVPGPEPRLDEPKHGAVHEAHRMLPIEDMQALLGGYAIPLSGLFVRSREELMMVTNELRADTYAIKAISQELVHKSDMHAVKLGLADADELGAAWDAIMDEITTHTPEAKIDGMLVQPMLRGTEVIVGMKRDATFGPVILAGLGGIFVELMKDVSMRIAPVSKVEARAMLSELRGHELFQGARGTAPVDLNALANVIVALSSLGLEHSEIQEIDLNPVIATPDGAYVVDARVMV